MHPAYGPHLNSEKSLGHGAKADLESDCCDVSLLAKLDRHVDVENFFSRPLLKTTNRECILSFKWDLPFGRTFFEEC